MPQSTIMRSENEARWAVLECVICPPYRLCPWTCVGAQAVPDLLESALSIANAVDGYDMTFKPVSENLYNTFHIL